nr:uncharacterized protein LOC120368101 [Saimiri boliviensis boliviensis]
MANARLGPAAPRRTTRPVSRAASRTKPRARPGLRLPAGSATAPGQPTAHCAGQLDSQVPYSANSAPRQVRWPSRGLPRVSLFQLPETRPHEWQAASKIQPRRTSASQ